MGHRILLILSVFLTTTIYICNGCQMEGVVQWPVPVSVTIYDTHRGTVLNRGTSEIEGINSINIGDGLNAGPYLEISYSDSQFLMWTNDAFERYEENEVEESMSMTVNFRCTGGTTRTLVFWISVIDTNNNAPQFRPSDALEFTIATPVPPGFLVTGCFNDITVRDIDLTTQRIDFGIEENPFFEIAYDASLSTTPKEFKATLRTKTFIRTLTETIVLRISATDVDLTGDPPITTYGTIRVASDTEFQFPEEPVFSQIFYLADYNSDHTLVHEPISLRQGYDEHVLFSLDGDYTDNFQLIKNGNQISITVQTPLNATTLMEQHILLIVTAQREYTSGAATTIVVRLPEVISLEFERAHYNGNIINNNLQLSNLILSQGYQGSVSVTVLSEYESYFSAVIQGNSITVTMRPLSENIILNNSFIYLEVVASTDRSSSRSIVTLEIIKDDNVTPVFNNGIYTGNYDSAVGLTVEPIYFVQGFDEDVTVSIAGDHSEYFQIMQNGPNINIISSELPPEIYSEHHLLFSIEASKPRTVGANAAVVIYLPAARVLDFEAPNYKGTLHNNVLTIETIVLGVGYDSNVNFNLTGDHASFFTVSNNQNRVTLNMLTTLPDSVISENNLLILNLNAFGLNAITTSTNIVLEIIKEDVTTPLFNRNIYFGDYNGNNNFNIENINLRQGYDERVSFRIEGEHSHYFGISNVGNNVILSLLSAIPRDVIFNEKVLSFSIIAEKALTVGANAAVLIRFPVELTDSAVMRFSRNTYVGSLENEILTLESVILTEGYESDTQFTLTGDYAQYFIISNTNNLITVALRNALPNQVIEDNNVLVLDIEARRDRAVSVSTSIVIDIIKEDVIHPVFSEAFYRGTYTEDEGLKFEEEIYLLSGHDDTVTYRLEGEFAELVSLVLNNSVLSLRLNTPVPQNVMEENIQLLFVIVADKPNAVSGRSVVSIELLKEETELVILSFTQNSYVGVLQDNTLQLPFITLVNNSHQHNLALDGEFASHFAVSQENNIIRIDLIRDLTPDIQDANNLVVLNLIATYDNAISGHTTIVIELVKDSELNVPVFNQPYYIGEYSEETGLLFNHIIQLIQGYDESVTITLVGDDAQWFRLVQNEPNNYRLLVIDEGIRLENRDHLIFSVVASTPENINIHATIVISLTEVTEGMSLLGFERITYTGSIQNDVATLEPIVLSEGFTAGVTFSMFGDLAQHFILTSVGPTVTIALRGALPAEAIPTNRVIVLEIRATAPQAVPAHTSVVFTVTTEDDTPSIVELAFSQVYYTGSYSETTGLTFVTPMSLSQGYDESVQFALVGDQAQWFGLVRNQNSVTLTLTSAIPTAVISNNNQLIFVVTAQREGATIARTTVVIALTDAEITEGMSLLGFERITYTGSIQNDVATLEPIVLSEGFTAGVTFSMFGDLAQHFILTSVGPTVTIALRGALPAEAIPANRVIVIEIRATAPQAVPAHTSVVFTVTTEDDTPSIVELAFAQVYYTGSYSETTGITFVTPMSLSQGYDESVQFALVGDQAQWFGLLRNQNSVTLTLTSAIPTAVISNNNQLIFVVTAQREGATIARTTVVIALTDEEITEGMSLLGFERITYTGSIQNDVATLEPIVLSEGFTAGVTFSMFGDLAQHFILTSVGPTVTIALRGALPAEAIPANRVIVLEIRATAPQAVPAHTSVVFTVTTEDDTPSIVELAFAQVYYTGSYSETTGLTFVTPMSLSQGYDESVQFALVGDQAQWFGLVRNQNSVTLTLTSAIPTAVISNNNQLIFVVTAQREGATIARTTVVIALTDEEITEGMSLLGFERITYTGSIQNDVATLEPIVLSEGFTAGVTFSMFGDLAQHFILTSVGPTVTIALRGALPAEAIPANRVIVLEIRATAPQAVPAHTSVVFTVTTEDDTPSIVELAFAQVYYTGSYSETTGLTFVTPMSLSQGYDESVQFALVGDQAQWFGLLRNQNSVTLTLTSAIPTAVISNNNQLIFVVTAQREGATIARTTVVIALTDEEITEGMSLLGFERITYTGSIQNDVATLEPIVLSEGFTAGVTFSMFGDLAQHFILTSVGPTVTIALRGALPAEAIPANRVIVLEIRATAPQAVPAHTSVVFTVTTEDDTPSIVELAFAQVYYTGSYSETTGLTFVTPMSLSQGYDESVQFALVGDQAQWFGLVRNQNSVTLTLTSAIPTAVISNNNQLIFVVTAQREGATIARTTVVIALTDGEITEGMSLLGFERITYTGSIQNDVATLEPIVLSEGFTAGVTFSMFGDLAQHFILTSVGPTVTIALRGALPAEAIPANRAIVLEIRATAPQAVPAHTSVVFTVTTEDDTPSIVELAFSQVYYTGSYSETTGLTFVTPMSLSQGYDESVQFALVGDQAQWFGLVRNQNSVTLTLTSAIPTAVISNNNQLIFVVTAQREGATIARTTVVIALTDGEITEGMSLLGFERITYTGSIQNDVATLEPIVLSEGFTAGVTFSMFGDLAQHFILTSVGPTVTIALRGALPAEAIPANRVIVLEIRATAPQAVPAHTSVVFTVTTEDDTPSIVELAFAQVYYTGSYSETTGLTFVTPMSLSQGYDESVQFALVGDQAQWFGLVRNQNSVTLTLTSAIPTAVISNNNQLIFVVTAQREGATIARTTVVIALTDGEITEGMSLLGFERITYTGSIQNDVATLEPIVLSEGFTAGVTFSMFGDLAQHFILTSVGPTVTIALRGALPAEAIPANRAIVLEIRATAPQAVPAHTSVVFTVTTEDDTPSIVELAFSQVYYTGSYSETTGLTFVTPMSLSQGYDESVQFALVGDQAQWFGLVRNQNSVTLTLTSAIPTAVISNNNQLIFVVTAQREGATIARTTVVIALTDGEITEGMSLLGFERITYTGSIQNDVATLEPIVLSEGFTAGVTFSMFGDLAQHFILTSVGPTVTIALRGALPAEAIPANRVIVLEIRATAPQAVPAHTSVVFTVTTEDDTPSIVELAFAQVYYTGSYSETTGLTFVTPMSLSQGYDESVQFALVGDQAQWFGLVRNQNSVTLTLTSAIPTAVISNNNQLIFVVTAQREGATIARTTVVIALTDGEITEGMSLLGFERITYTGSIQNDVATLEPIVLSEGFTAGVTFSMFGDLAQHFILTSVGPTVTIALRGALPAEAIPANRVIVLEIRATAPQAVPAHTSVVFTVTTEDDTPSIVELAFAQVYYTGSYSETTGLTFVTPMSLSQGYDESVQFALVGDQAQWFGLLRNQNSVTLTLTSAIPTAVISNYNQLIFVVTAQKEGGTVARTIIVISLTDTQVESDVRFENVLYEGGIQNNILRHENIVIFGFSGTNIQLHGEYASMFISSLNDGVVSIQMSVSMNLPDDVVQIVLEMHAATARAVLLLNVISSDAPSIPSVTFSSSSYSLHVDVSQTGLVGNVYAVADNGESVRYTIRAENSHLLERLSINNDGELRLSAPVNSGVYTFEVIATTIFTQATATATVHLTVETVTICRDDVVVPPLIVLDRDEEAPHNNLVVLNTTQHPNCRYTLTNRWPSDHSWLYVDEIGLHARPIDREHESIAFMALSQIQVEINLHCDGDRTRAKRSTSNRPEWLGPYDYGTSNWILSDSISYNSRRSFVNLIVNDINDNAPIFIGKENEPIAVGYPIFELEESVMPRSLVELQATDADIGINAALMYWSSETELAVAPSTGFVHVRDGARLEQDARLIVHATDRNGEGHTGSIELIVKLLDINNIIVVTVSDAFLDEEKTILTELSKAVGYDVRILRSTMVSQSTQSDEGDSSRKKRNVGATGASLQLYVYGLIEREPVSVDRLTTDINNNAIIAVSIVSTVSLEDHLEGQEICVIPGRDTGLLVATIVLSILLFILIVLIAVWFILRRRKKQDYDQFSDQNSLASRNESLGQLPKSDTIVKPRLNIEDLKKSERRLQEMLDAPLEEVIPHTSRAEVPFESILDIPTVEPHAPIVIQSIDKLKDATDESEDDEFGETNKARRKSVVTFNENVEKIIHVEDDEEPNIHPGYEGNKQ